MTVRDTGDGDRCPLFPEHGHMMVVKGSIPAIQWCPHVDHDGGTGKSGIPKSRSRWPLYGFEDSVKSYMARLDRAIKQASLPDISDVEVT